ncbi:hypothetical protein T03_7722, partial [Trichinella britovi]
LSTSHDASTPSSVADKDSLEGRRCERVKTLEEAKDAIAISSQVINLVVPPLANGDSGSDDSDIEYQPDDLEDTFDPAVQLEVEEELDMDKTQLWMLCGSDGCPYHMIFHQEKECQASNTSLSTRVATTMIDAIRKAHEIPNIYYFLTTSSKVILWSMTKGTLSLSTGNSYHLTIRSKKWYRSLFITALNVATVAAWRICI